MSRSNDYSARQTVSIRIDAFYYHEEYEFETGLVLGRRTYMRTSRNWKGDCNPPSGYRKRWRRQFRARANRQLREAMDYDSMLVYSNMRECTNEWDWY